MNLDTLELGDIITFKRYKPNFAYRPILVEQIDGAEVVGICKPKEYMPPPIVRHWYGDPESDTEPDYRVYCLMDEYRIRILLNPPISENAEFKILELSQLLLDAGSYSIEVTDKAEIGDEINRFAQQRIGRFQGLSDGVFPFPGI